jgi:tRNA dimethylallyltransferase
MTDGVAMAGFEDGWRVVALIGPTASGKSALALRAAEAVDGEILAVDSMTVYRGMDVGTAKPSPAERERVRHHLVDVVDPTESFTVARFVELADAAIADARRRRVPLIAVGGTPLYFKALFDGLFEGPGADDAIRARLNQQSTEDLHARLREVDPPAAGRIHVNDRKRLVRALEVHQLTGRPISSFQTHWDGSAARRHPVTWFGLNWERDELSRRINARVKQMIADGWPDEVRALLDRHGRLSATAAEAAGYQHLVDHVEGRVSLDDAVEQIKIATRQLSRRQVKWFRRFPGVTWIPGERAGDEEVEHKIAAAAVGDQRL